MIYKEYKDSLAGLLPIALAHEDELRSGTGCIVGLTPPSDTCGIGAFVYVGIRGDGWVVTVSKYRCDTMGMSIVPVKISRLLDTVASLLQGEGIHGGVKFDWQFDAESDHIPGDDQRGENGKLTEGRLTP